MCTINKISAHPLYSAPIHYYLAQTMVAQAPTRWSLCSPSWTFSTDYLLSCRSSMPKNTCCMRQLWWDVRHQIRFCADQQAARLLLRASSDAIFFPPERQRHGVRSFRDVGSTTSQGSSGEIKGAQSKATISPAQLRFKRNRSPRTLFPAC